MRLRRQPGIGLLCVLIILLGGLLSGVTGVGAVRAAGTFTDAQGRFSFAIPDGLTADDSFTGQRIRQTEIAAVLFSDAAASSGFRDNVNVTIEAASGNTTNLDDLAHNTVQQASDDLHSTPDGTGIQSLTIGGLPARQYAYLSVFGGVTVHGTQAFVIKDGYAYVITFSASEDTYADFIAQTRDILTSFTFDPAM